MDTISVKGEVAVTYTEKEFMHSPPGLLAYMGKVCIASIYYGSNSKTETQPWRVTMRLPGYKRDTIKISNRSDGREVVERHLAVWLEWVGIK